MGRIQLAVVLFCIVLGCSVTSASAQISIGIGLPNVSIGINVPLFPELIPVPGYPVYYAPRLDANYFFYDGMYWVYQDDNWYASYWYNGPWWVVEPEVIPVFILRIPVRYYRAPPPYFRGWRADAPPRWGRHWGPGWERQRRGWDKWRRGSAPARAPLPVYQRQYSGDRYPRQVEQQQILRNEHYRYQPRDRRVREHFPPQGAARRTVPTGREIQEEPRRRAPMQPDMQRPAPRQLPPPQGEPVLRERREQEGERPRQQRPEPHAIQREMPAPRPEVQEPRSFDRGKWQEPRGQGHEQRREEGHGRER